MSNNIPNQQPVIYKLNGTTIAGEELDRQIQKRISSARVTGLSMALFNANKTVYCKAFGYANHAAKTPLKTESIMHGASLSKAIFSYITVVLSERGVIELDKPLHQYLNRPLPKLIADSKKGYEDLQTDSRYEKITARMCLSHTTGFPNWRWLSRTGAPKPNGKLKLFFEPGAEYFYSGEGFMLLQYVMEEITGKGLEELAKEIVFEPLKMQMSSYIWQKRFENSYSNGHTAKQDVLPKKKASHAKAAGSLETTLTDYSKFIRHLLVLFSENSGITRQLFRPNIRIHTKAQFGPQAMEYTDENEAIGLSYGLGWGLLDSPYGRGAFKEGHGKGFQHYSILFPEKATGLIILSNSDRAEGIFKELLSITIADIYTPWKWENYIPHQEA